jgi:glycosyltransferase involved in cell wall biosynthesis
MLREQTSLEPFYPSVKLRELVASRIRAEGAACVLTIWSPEGVAATHGLRDRPRISYQGDIDFQPSEVRLMDHRLFFEASGSDPWSQIREVLQRARRRLWLLGYKRAHLTLIRGLDAVANIAADTAEFYARHGHPRSIYVRNTWPVPTDVQPIEPAVNGHGQPALPQPRPIMIIGHVGYLNRTGSTYGLRFLLMELLPELEVAMQDRPYDVHIIGGGEVVPGLRPYLRHPRLKMRGFVEDLGAELRAADVLLVLNNCADVYQAAYTRHMMAWSMGLCLIAHARGVRPIPEIVHGENALTGSTAREIAQLILRAATDTALNQRIRRGGRAVYERCFAPSIVARNLHDVLMSVVPTEGH